MDEYITSNRDLIKAIDCIPVPDITVSSLSQQSARLTKKENSLTKEQVMKILKKTQPQEQTAIQPRANLYLNAFNQYDPQEMFNKEKINKHTQQKNLLDQISQLQQQVDYQRREIESQINQIALLNKQTNHLTNEIQEKNIQLQMNAQTIQQLHTINVQQQQIIENISLENEYKKKFNKLCHQKESESITELKSKIQNLESEINKTRATFTLFSPKNETFQSDSQSYKNKTFDPELLSEDETLTILLSLLNRVSKSFRMTAILQKNADFKKLIKFKRNQPSVNRLSIVQNNKSLERQSSCNQEYFNKLIKNQGIKFY
ncbi:unnamed protein product [Paramecium pentaurelia]|uniref:Uncharacterized protein n=1 Tax=Paramecium pentaurelia TaxID=43138 RepID=A0A8S1T1Y2_9CILI|nr:unnamed protein product [Paramecium pentaurelia]